MYSRDHAPCVYFIQEGISGPIKIGFTVASLYSRLDQLQKESPAILTIRGVIHDQDPHALEGALHLMFAEYRLHGEWFLPSAAIKSFIRDHAIPVVYQTSLKHSGNDRPFCVECMSRFAVTTDGRLCKGCLRKWANTQSPGVTDRTTQGKPLPNSHSGEQDPEFENAVKMIEGD